MVGDHWTEAVPPSLVGMMALMDVPRYAGEWPQIGQILSYQEEEVTIH